MKKARIRPNPDEWIYATDAANSMGCCVRTITRMIKAGELPGYRIGKTFRIPLDAWAAVKRGEWEPLPKRVIVEVPGMPAPEMLHKRKAS